MYLTTAARTSREVAAGLGQPAADPVAAVGEALWREAPAGVTVAIYYDDAEQRRRAVEWAARERAIGPTGRRIAAADLAFGRAIADGGSLVTQLTQLGAALSQAVGAVPQPAGTTPLPGTGPALIRTLALFTHGTTGWVSIGGGIRAATVGALIRRIAPALTNDVKILLYGCSSARGQTEPSSWVRTTATDGGADSLAGALRDALIDAGKTGAVVWGHTEVGHTTRNPSLRSFGAAWGRGSPGQSYLSQSVFGVLSNALLAAEITTQIGLLGHAFPASRQAAFQAALQGEVRRLRYSCWVGAVVRVRNVGAKRIKETNLTVRGASLPEVAPLYPLEVADVVRQRWSDVCWTPAAKEAAARKVARNAKLPRQAQTAGSGTSN